MWTKEDLDVFFKAFTYGVFSAGGDGDGELACQNHYDTHQEYYKDVADAFGDYEIEYHDGTKHKMKEIYTRRDSYEDGYVLFTDGLNENFVISKYYNRKSKGRIDDIFMVI